MKSVYIRRKGMEHPLIDLSHIFKSYDGDLILDDLSLSVKGKLLRDAARPERLRKDNDLKNHRWV